MKESVFEKYPLFKSIFVLLKLIPNNRKKKKNIIQQETKILGLFLHSISQVHIFKFPISLACKSIFFFLLSNKKRSPKTTQVLPKCKVSVGFVYLRAMKNEKSLVSILWRNVPANTVFFYANKHMTFLGWTHEVKWIKSKAG